MKIHYCKNYIDMSRQAADYVISGLKEKPAQSLCIASGNSPLGLYKNLTDAYRAEPGYFRDLKIVKLDEWGGINPNDENSGESFIKNNILQSLDIPESNYISFQTNPIFPEVECERIQKKLKKLGPIDVCILGLGKNGHLGFNEPGLLLNPNCHVAKLSRTSMEHQMANAMEKKPQYGLTLGMADIFKSRRIILMVSGKGKQQVIKNLLTQKITTQLPASLLWLHQNVHCYIDLESID